MNGNIRKKNLQWEELYFLKYVLILKYPNTKNCAIK